MLCRICNFLVQISDVPSHIAGAVCCPVGLCVQTSLDTSVYASAGANGDGTQRPAVCTGETRSLLRGKDMEQADRRRAKLMSIVNYLYLMPLRQHHIASRSVAKIERTRVINARRLLWRVYTHLGHFLTIAAKILGIFILKKRKFHRNESSREWKFLERSLPRNESSTEAKVTRSECSTARKIHGNESYMCGLTAPGNESAEERKVRHSPLRADSA